MVQIWCLWDCLVSQRVSVLLGQSYLLRQVQVCMSLARGTDDPALKRQYEDLAVGFAQSIGSERDVDMSVTPLGGINPKPDSGDTSPHR